MRIKLCLLIVVFLITIVSCSDRSLVSSTYPSKENFRSLICSEFGYNEDSLEIHRFSINHERMFVKGHAGNSEGLREGFQFYSGWKRINTDSVILDRDFRWEYEVFLNNKLETYIVHGAFENGIRHGPFVTFVDGSLVNVVHLKEGELHGTEVEFTSQRAGKVGDSTIIHYERQVAWLMRECVEGVLENKTILYHNNGITEAFWNYHDGRLCGPFKRFYESGMLRESGTYDCIYYSIYNSGDEVVIYNEDDELIDWRIEFSEHNKALLWEEIASTSKDTLTFVPRTGTYKEFNKDGSLELEVNYDLE